MQTFSFEDSTPYLGLNEKWKTANFWLGSPPDYWLIISGPMNGGGGMNDSRRKEYLALLDQIAELERKKLKLEKEQETVRDRQRIIHSELLLEINMAKDEKGKPIYSNEHLRRAALHLKLEEHEEYLELRKKSRLIEHERREIYIEYNNLIDRKQLLMFELGTALEVEMKKDPSIH